MQFRVLGPLELADAGRVTTTASACRRRLLAALVAHVPAGVPASHLVDAVWGVDPPPTARASLQSHVSRLRSLLRGLDPGRDRVVTYEDGYGLLLTDADEVDAALFASGVARARELLVADPDGAFAEATRALDRWRGAPYADAAEAVPDEVSRLWSLRREAEALRTDARLAAGEAGAVVADLEARLVQDPLDERAVGQLMLALSRTGRQAAALRAFHDVRTRLAEDLGVDPSPWLQHRYTSLLRQDPAVVGAVEAPVRPEVAMGSAGRPPRPRTRQLTNLVDRDESIAEVAGLLADEALVTLTGPGGVGKTRLALAVAARAAEAFDDVHVLRLAPVRVADDLDAVLAHACGVAPVEETAMRAHLVDALAGRRVLLVADNCEHLLPEVAELVGHLLAHCPSLVVLATSRERLAVSGERRWPVAPLRLPAVDADLRHARQSPAVRVFCDRARAVDPSFALTAQNAASVVELCRRMDGLPLALELAAARVAAFDVAELARRSEAAVDLLTTGPPDEGGRHRTLRDVVAWSYSLLTPDEADLFDRLSVFAGGFTVPAVEAVAAGHGEPPGPVVARLGALVDCSMVTRAGARYHVLEPLRLFGATRLAERGLDEEMRRRHARHFGGFSERAGQALRGGDDVSWVPRVEAELDNLRTAHRWALDNGEAALALRLSAPLGWYADLWLVDEVATWAEAAARLPGAEGHALLPVAWGTAARGAGNRGELARSTDYARRGLQAADPGDPSRILPLHALALVAFYQGRLEASEELERQVLSLAAGSGNTHEEAYVWVLRALIETYRARPEAARSAAARAGELADALGSAHMRALAAYARGEVLASVDTEEALTALDAAVDGARRVGARLVEAVALVTRSTLRAELGDPAAALASFREAVDRLRRGGNWTHQWTTLRNLVVLLTRLDADEAAAQLVGALESTTTAARPYGRDAQRLQDVVDRLARRLGPEAFPAARGRGQRLKDPQAVDLALTTIDRLLVTIAVADASGR